MISHTGLDSIEAGAPAEKMEITPAMIQAGIAFMEAEALDTLTGIVVRPDFIRAFLQAIFRAPNSPCGGRVPSTAAQSREFRR